MCTLGYYELKLFKDLRVLHALQPPQPSVNEMEKSEENKEAF